MWTNLFKKKTKDEHKDEHKTIFQHRYLHALAKSTMAQGIEFLRLSGRVRNLTAGYSQVQMWTNLPFARKMLNHQNIVPITSAFFSFRYLNYKKNSTSINIHLANFCCLYLFPFFEVKLAMLLLRLRCTISRAWIVELAL